MPCSSSRLRPNSPSRTQASDDKRRSSGALVPRHISRHIRKEGQPRTNSSKIMPASHQYLRKRCANGTGCRYAACNLARRSRRLGRVDYVEDRKSVEEGTSVSVRVDFGGRRIIKKKN